ncbi:unnamed protein product [Closterium sp. Yama58-4]|nr:unnamed protein product [Closterium sp. Yama58-4]
MGQSASREELIRHAAKHGNTSAIRELASRGISVNCVDSKGRTPLILASSRAEGFEAVKVLLQMGALVRAYSKGPGGGTAIHYAARKQLDATVKLLLDHGADPLFPNDDGKTALDLARDRNATAIVRLIESRVALFEGYVRQQTLSAPSLVKAFIPQWVYRRIWVAVLPGPTMSDGRQTFRLALYPSMAFGTPYFDIALHVCCIHMTKLDSANPVLVIEDPVHEKGKWKFVSDKDSPDPSQIFRLHDACRGMPRTHPTMYPQPPTAPAAAAYAAPVAPTYAAPAATAYADPWGAYYTQQQAQQQQQAWQQYQYQQQQQQQQGGVQAQLQREREGWRQDHGSPAVW